MRTWCMNKLKACWHLEFSTYLDCKYIISDSHIWKSMFNVYYRERTKNSLVTYVKYACQESVPSIPLCYIPIGFWSNRMIYYLLLNCQLTYSHTCAFKSVYLEKFITWLWNTTCEVVSLFLHAFARKRDIKYTTIDFLISQMLLKFLTWPSAVQDNCFPFVNDNVHFQNVFLRLNLFLIILLELKCVLKA